MSTCSHQGCKKYSVYGHKEGQPTKCKTHAENNMEDVKHKRCEHPKCTTRSSYGILGGQPTRCKKHADDNMENIVSKRCEHPKCKKIPSYGMPGDRPTRCQAHADDGMENVVSKRCNHPGCKKQPAYGMPGDRPTKCQAHADDGMENIVSKRCEHSKCKKIPSYGMPGDRPTRCQAHADDGMENVVSKRCPGYGGIVCPTSYFMSVGKDYCLACDPNEKRKAIKKKDEYAFFKFLKKHNVEVTQEQYPIIFRCVETSRSHANVDGLIVTPTIVILLEVDENGHKSYDKECDKARTQLVSSEVLLAYPGHELAWVRVNPTASDNKIRKTRFFEAVESIRELLKSPRTTTIMIGF
ncbi:hypothetical protein MT325_M427R [Paramecium bursaria chlorella virus MT325]|uniref:Uncharacterized protein M427R n=1 Tax=Paramecium bursaria Chlorella virus MT325 TaxID=346932 RepID=A7IUF7_PBCVM|nr:hypothetical protein MT325_M427R [Paramecium bursaria chlorella virus MT325]AGE48838.1 hypothetical protein PBCVAP110A_503R [Paramecium bursaria Chlorella virus AP110A]